VPINERVVIGADMNGHVGLEAGGYEGVHGGHGFGDRNEEGSNLLEMAEGLDLVVVNTCFQKRRNTGLHTAVVRMPARLTTY